MTGDPTPLGLSLASVGLTVALLLVAPAVASAGPYGFQIPDTTTYRTCAVSPRPEPSPAQRLRSQVGLGAERATDKDSPWRFAVDIGLGYQLARVWRPCRRVTTGLFKSSSRRALGFGPSVRGVLVPASLEQSRLSGGLQVSFDGWSKGGLFSELNPIGVLQFDTGPSWGPLGAGYHARLGIFGVLSGWGLRYDYVPKAGAHVIGLSFDFSNMHLLFTL